MNKKIVIGIAIVVILVISIIVAISLVGNTGGQIFKNKDEIVSIESGTITNEGLVNQFIEDTNNNKETMLEIYEQNGENNIEKILKYIPVNKTYIDSEGISHENSEGIYVYITEEKEYIYSKEEWIVAKAAENEYINIVLKNNEETENINIFSYTLESSGYTKNIDLSFHYDEAIEETIIIAEAKDVDEYDIEAVQGRMGIIGEDGNLYTLEYGLENNFTTVEEILEQIAEDEKYGICSKVVEEDSIMYEYSDYLVEVVEEEYNLIIFFPNFK